MLLKPLIYYDKIYLYAKNIDEEKYQLLANELNKIAKTNKFSVDKIYEYSNSSIKDVDELENKLQKVIIFDDYICDKNQDQIVKYFIQGRYKNCSVIYLSQSYYKTDKNIRLNCDHFILYEMNSVREESMISKETSVPIEKYKKATKNQYHFLYIDKPNKTNDPLSFNLVCNIWEFLIIFQKIKLSLMLRVEQQDLIKYFLIML